MGVKRKDVDPARGVYMISVAAELAGMHPQTLRIYESRGLIQPKRSPKNTRLYSQEDVDRLGRSREPARGLATVPAGGRRPAAAHPGADVGARHDPRRRREGVRARAGTRADAPPDALAGAP